MGYTINLNDTDPVAPAGKVNVKWQKGVVPADPAQPVPVSAYVDASSAGGLSYTTDTGAANAYAGTWTPAPLVATGLTLALKATNTNTGASTLNPNGGGAVAIKKNGTTDLVAGDILAGTIYYFTYDGTYWQLVATPGVLAANAVVTAVHQTAHGFSTGQAVYNTGSAWALAKADAAGTLGVGIVLYIGTDDFSLYISGYMSELSGLTAGQYYFVSDSSAGTLTATEPTAVTSFSNPLLFALSSATGIVLPFRPSEISGAALIGSFSYATDSGAVNAYAGTFSPAPTLAAGLTLAILAAHTNTGASTLAPNGLGSFTIKKQNGATDLSAGDIVAGQVYFFTYDGTYFQLETPQGTLVTGPATAVASDFAQYDGTTGKLIKDGGLSLDTDVTLAANSDNRVPSQKSVKTYADTKAAKIAQDTLANIVASAPTLAKRMSATDIEQLMVADGTYWYIESSYLDKKLSTPSMGAEELTTNREGYGRDYITDKLLANCQVGANGTTKTGALRFNVPSNTLQCYYSGAWQALVAGFQFRESGFVFEDTPSGDTIGLIQVFSGNSEVLGLNGLPLVQGYKVCMGSYPFPPTISGGSF